MSIDAPIRTRSPAFIAAPKIESEWGRGWTALLGASIGLAIGSGMFLPTASLFILPLQNAFGWSQLQVASALSLAFIGAMCAPVVGFAVNAIGLRRVALAATCLICAAYVGLSLMPRSLLVFSGFCVLLTLAGAGASGLVYGRLVTSWFERSRGLALAVSRVGPALLGAAMPILLYWVIERFGWRAGYQTLAAVTATLGIPAVIWLVREPKATGGAPPPATIAQPAHGAWWRLLRDGRLWALAALAFLLSFPLLGLSLHLQPFLSAHGLSGGDPAKVIGGFSSAILIGAFLSGLLIDRHGPRLAGMVFMGAAILGFLALTTVAKGPAGASAAIVLIGLNQGVEYDLLAFLIARQFGREGFSPVYGVVTVATALAATSGAATFALLRDRTGSYDAALWLSIICLIAALAMLLTLGGAGRRTASSPA